MLFDVSTHCIINFIWKIFNISLTSHYIQKSILISLIIFIHKLIHVLMTFNVDHYYLLVRELVMRWAAKNYWLFKIHNPSHGIYDHWDFKGKTSIWLYHDHQVIKKSNSSHCRVVRRQLFDQMWTPRQYYGFTQTMTSLITNVNNLFT